jgi:hypothetical protein
MADPPARILRSLSSVALLPGGYKEEMRYAGEARVILPGKATGRNAMHANNAVCLAIELELEPDKAVSSRARHSYAMGASTMGHDCVSDDCFRCEGCIWRVVPPAIAYHERKPLFPCIQSVRGEASRCSR